MNYFDRSGRTVQNDNNADWLEPAFREAYRTLKPHSFMVSFYAWNRIAKFLAAWRRAGFYIVGHMVFRKRLYVHITLPSLPTRTGVFAGKGKTGITGESYR